MIDAALNNERMLEEGKQHLIRVWREAAQLLKSPDEALEIRRSALVNLYQAVISFINLYESSIAQDNLTQASENTRWRSHRADGAANLLELLPEIFGFFDEWSAVLELPGSQFRPGSASLTGLQRLVAAELPDLVETLRKNLISCSLPVRGFSAHSDQAEAQGIPQNENALPSSAGGCLLFLASSPLDREELELDREFNLIRRRLEKSGFGAIRMARERKVAAIELASLIMKHDPSIIHFSGHGDADGRLVFQSTDGSSTPADPETIARIFSRLSTNVRCVVLNACYSAVQAEEISKYVDVVIGIKTIITDEQSIQLSIGFYEALFYGRSVQEAIDVAKYRLSHVDLHQDVGIAVHHRSNVVLSNMHFSGAPPTQVGRDTPMSVKSPGIVSTTSGRIDGNKDVPPATIGIIAALPKEFAALRLIFGDGHGELKTEGKGAGRRFRLVPLPSQHGGSHIIALALLPDMGNNVAAIMASILINQVPSVEHIIMCGIAGGIPNRTASEHDVRLGDIVVSNRNGVVQYDLVKEHPDGTIESRSPGRPPGAELLEAVQYLEVEEELGNTPWLDAMSRVSHAKWQRPNDNIDALGTPVALPIDPERIGGVPRVFRAPVASANRLLKNRAHRDYLGAKFGVKAVEMEGSGIADATWFSDRTGYLVVRGIADYCDGEKGDFWHRAAALAAASYTRALLASMHTNDRSVPTI